MLDIAIIGGGVAGLTAGLYAARGGAEAMVFEELFVGGQAASTSRIENYPGFPDGIEGVAIGPLIEEQAQKFGLKIGYDPVTAVDLARRVLTVGGQQIEARAIILCMGATPRKLCLAREDALTGRGVSYCATCDGAIFKGQDVAVVGGGDTALSDALYLARFCSSVTVIHRRDELRAARTLQEAARQKDNIRFAYSSVCTALLGEDKLTGLSLKNLTTNEESALSVSGVFMAVGIAPRTELVAGQLTLCAEKSILTNERMETSVPGVYAAGDVRNSPLRQVVTACADGAVAATEAVAFLALGKNQA